MATAGRKKCYYNWGQKDITIHAYMINYV